MDSIAQWFAQLGPIGAVLFVAVYFVVTLVPIPTAPFTLAGGALFGSITGFVLIMLATMAGSCAAFAIGRRALRTRVQRIVKRHPKLDAVDAALRDDSWKSVALVQMSPGIPFGIQNYFLGASKVDFIPYTVGTLVGIIPSTAMYTFVGYAGRTALVEGGPGKWALLALGLAAAAILFWRIRRMAKRRLHLA